MTVGPLTVDRSYDILLQLDCELPFEHVRRQRPRRDGDLVVSKRVGVASLLAARPLSAYTSSRLPSVRTRTVVGLERVERVERRLALGPYPVVGCSGEC
jgi:hypothetical protein